MHICRYVCDPVTQWSPLSSPSLTAPAITHLLGARSLLPPHTQPAVQRGIDKVNYRRHTAEHSATTRLQQK